MSDVPASDGPPEGAKPEEPKAPEGAATGSAATGAAPPGAGGPAAPGGPTAQNGAGNGRAPEEMSVGELVFEVSDRASVLVREEIELAKTEVTEKFNTLMRGSITAVAAGVFVLAALAMFMHGFAWLINDLFFDNFWAGFMIEATLFLIAAAIAGLVAKKLLEDSSPPTPDMAIEQAKEIKKGFEESFESKESSA